jgi:hypothetical protein
MEYPDRSHLIGRKYKYTRSDKVFTLAEIDRYLYKFACGHWCTDTVFVDLIDIETGIQNYKLLGTQLTIF